MRGYSFRLFLSVVVCLLLVSVTPAVAVEIDLCCDHATNLNDIDPILDKDVGLTNFIVYNDNLVFKEDRISAEYSIAKFMDNSKNVERQERNVLSNRNIKIFISSLVILVSLIVVFYGIIHKIKVERSYASKNVELDNIKSKGSFENRDAIYNSEMQKVDTEMRNVDKNIADNMGEINAKNVPNQKDKRLIEANRVAFHEWREDLVDYRKKLQLERESYLRDLETSNTHTKWIREIYPGERSYAMKMVTFGSLGTILGSGFLIHTILLGDAL